MNPRTSHVLPERTEMESSRLNAERVSLLEGRPREFQCSNFFKGWKFFLQSTVTKVQAMHIHTYIYTHEYQVVER